VFIGRVIHLDRGNAAKNSDAGHAAATMSDSDARLLSRFITAYVFDAEVSASVTARVTQLELSPPSRSSRRGSSLSVANPHRAQPSSSWRGSSKASRRDGSPTPQDCRCVRGNELSLPFGGRSTRTRAVALFALQCNDISRKRSLCKLQSNFRRKDEIFFFFFIVDEWTKTSTKLAGSRCARNVAKLKNRNREFQLRPLMSRVENARPCARADPRSDLDPRASSSSRAARVDADGQRE
jgi:hypothetical protein